jgi:hypothetical protein
MTLLRSHVFLMFVYAIATGSFFALLWREERRARIRLFLVVFSSLFFGGIILGWLMFAAPYK